MEILVEYAVLVGVQEQNNEHFDYEMEELRNLAEAINVQVVGTVTQNLERRHPSTYVGKGKIDGDQAVLRRDRCKSDHFQ